MLQSPHHSLSWVLARTGLFFTRIWEGAQFGRLTQPQAGQTEQGIPYHVPSCWVPVGGSWGAGTHSRLGSAGADLVRENGSVGCAVHFVFISSSVSLLFLFPLFAVLLNCTYPDPQVFCLFLSILLRTTARGGAAAWRFCCLLQPNQNILIALCWTVSSSSSSFLKWGAQNWTQYSR